MNSKLVAPLLGAALALFGAAPALAVGTRTFVLDTLDSFKGGELKGVAVGSDGTVRAGLSLANLPIIEATTAWDSLLLSDGSVLIGTGPTGRVHRIKDGKATLVAETDALGVSTLVLGFDGLAFAGSFPDGKIFKLAPDTKDAKKLEPWVTLPETEDVWELAYDAKNKALYAATGPEGRLYRIDAAGKAEVYFDSEESHLVSVAVATDGKVYAGSSGKALLYEITAVGRARVVHDFEGDDVRAIAIAQTGAHAGAIYAVANDYRGALKQLRPPKRARMAPSPSDDKSMKAGHGRLVRFGKDGVLERLLDDDETHFASLALDAAGAPYVGTGAEGRIYTVDDNHVTRLVADTEERQITAILLGEKSRHVIGSDPLVYHDVTGQGGEAAVWTSKVLDAGLRAHFGLLDLTADGQLEIETRSGNTDPPDATWSEWSKPLATSGKLESPAARFLQLRARFARDPSAVLRGLRVAFVTDNARAVLTEVAAGEKDTDTGSASVPASGAQPSEPSSKLRLQWKLDNPDSDELRFRLFFRGDKSPRWTSLLEPREVLTKREYTWETAGLPEGRYRVRVDATDELANAPGQATQHSLESQVVLVDNTPPRLEKLSLKGSRLAGRATDGVGPIQRVELALVGDNAWYPLVPTDGVFDEATEDFDLDVSQVITTGPDVFVVVRAYDAAGNRINATVPRQP